MSTQQASKLKLALVVDLRVVGSVGYKFRDGFDV